MRLFQYFWRRFRLKSDQILNPNTAVAYAAFLLVGCGGGSKETDGEIGGFPQSYVPPKSGYDPPNFADPHADVLNIPYVRPYWVASLEMDQWEVHVIPMLEDFDRTINYTFPNTQPEYDHYNITGWQHATEEIKIATRTVFSKFAEILDVTFAEVEFSDDTNVIAVGRSLQTTSAGYSFFPNNFYKIGMDIFISDAYDNPRFTSTRLTNYDYEVLVHELGHALGLKHPFEPSGTNVAMLTQHEDNTFNTAMSYNISPATFNGMLRPLDWMALAKFYGVKSTYNADNDTYSFSTLGGQFILDGGGLDTISVLNALSDVTIDLRQGAHSFLGKKSNYIADANQLTISHGSDIENVETGSGNSTIIGNSLDNTIVTGSGNDLIYAGAGADNINSGTGKDQIDLSEEIQARDTVVLGSIPIDLEFISIYGFIQGPLGDILDLSAVLVSVPKLFPLVISENSPSANFSGGVLRISGNDLSTASRISEAFEVGGGAEPLTISVGAQALIISADSQATGMDQSIFHAEGTADGISITQLAFLQGNGLDIDQWHADNFSYIA